MIIMTFRQIDKQSEKDRQAFLTLLLDYIHELDLNKPHHITSDETIKDYANGMINRQGDFDRHLEFCYFDDVIVGFLYAKVDHVGHFGFIKPEYGFIMEFYVKPQYRRKGYGKAMFEHTQTLFCEHVIKKMYLTADPVTGEKFWHSMGFIFSGEVSPENSLNIFEKDVTYGIGNNSESRIEFVKIYKGNDDNCSAFMNLGYEYMKETSSEYSLQVHEKFLNSILNKQGERNRWLILLKVNGVAIGFVHSKIDENERVGWGYILKSYIAPTFRRKGFGANLYNFMKQTFIDYGIKNIWLTADKITGEPFWFSIGFTDTGEVENGQKVLEISI